MNLVLKVLGGVSILLIICMFICGIWVKSHPVDDIGFHFKLGIATLLVSLVTIILFMMKK